MAQQPSISQIINIFCLFCFSFAPFALNLDSKRWHGTSWSSDMGRGQQMGLGQPSSFGGNLSIPCSWMWLEEEGNSWVGCSKCRVCGWLCIYIHTHPQLHGLPIAGEGGRTLSRSWSWSGIMEGGEELIGAARQGSGSEQRGKGTSVCLPFPYVLPVASYLARRLRK